MSPEYRAELLILPKSGIPDPGSASIRDQLHLLGFDSVIRVRAGKRLEVTMHAKNRKTAERDVEIMAKKLLVHPILEQYTYTLHTNRKRRGRH